MTTIPRKPDTIYPGSRCAVEFDGVRAIGTYSSKTAGGYFVVLDGTGQGVTVPGDWIKPLDEGES